MDIKAPRYFASGDKSKKKISSKKVHKNKDFKQKRNERSKKKKELYPGDAPIPSHKLEKYKRGEEMEIYKVKTKYGRKIQAVEENKKKFCVEQSARTELLLTEDVGFLESEGEETYKISQSEIASSVDITSSSKYFDLKLHQFGPYQMDYSREGRYLLLGGRRGHVAAIDWVTKKLLCEINVMESVHDVKWLHMPTQFAVAQKDWVYIYDKEGTELHCVKKLYGVLCMEYLPYHFLLATASEKSFLSWVDISIGKMVAQFYAKKGRLNILTQNPYNAVLLTGHANGTVAMWSPNMNEPLVSMLCHPHPIRAIAVNKEGMYMATCAVDRSVKIWDIRNYKCLQSYKLGGAANSVTFSDNNFIGVGMGNVVEVYKDCCTTTAYKPYLRHKLDATVLNVQFAPHEDVLGISHNIGFTSMLVPGSAEPNFDAWEANPNMTKTQRRELEIKALLEKIQPELIALDPHELSKVDTQTLKEKLEEKKKILYLKPPRIEFEPKRKQKGRSTGVKLMKRKKGKQEEEKRKFIQEVVRIKKSKAKAAKKPKSVLDRFQTKPS